MTDPRPATSEELPEILDLLGRYDLAPGYFDPWYLEDPEYHIDHSWIVRERGAVVAHLRVFPRTLRLAGGGQISVAGIGNVITHPEHRGRGHAARLLTASLSEATRQGFAFSLLWTHVPRVYEPHGYGATSQLLLDLDPSTLSTEREPTRYLLDPFEQDDLPEVRLLYERANARRAGTMVRTEPYWRGLLARTSPATSSLLARTEHGTLAGHLRVNRAPGGEVVVEELSILPEHPGAARALLGAAVTPPSSHIKLLAPPSYEALLRDHIRDKSRESGLMGRPLHLGALAQALGALVGNHVDIATLNPHRVRLSGLPDVKEDLMFSQAGATVVPREPSAPAFAVDTSQLTGLLFAGDALVDDAPPGELADAGGLADTIFPIDDPVLWPADAF